MLEDVMNQIINPNIETEICTYIKKGWTKMQKEKPNRKLLLSEL